jgi:hypothetical protein
MNNEAASAPRSTLFSGSGTTGMKTLFEIAKIVVKNL